jgi:hypothetical protein
MAADYTNIDELINDFQLMVDDTSYDKEAQVYQLRLLALQGLRELTFDVEQVVKTSTHTVTSDLKITLPSDYVKMVRVGYKNSDNEFVSLGYKSNLTLDSSVTSQVSDNNFDENNPYYHTDIGRKFGVGGGKNGLGYYRVNRNDDCISFSSELNGQVVFMEYISDGTSDTNPKNHIISLSFDNAIDIDTGSTLRIPKYGDASDHVDFTVTINNTDGAYPSSNTELLIQSTSSSAAIAQKFEYLINFGHPESGVSPYNSNLKASRFGASANSAYNIVTLTYYDEATQLTLTDSDYDINVTNNILTKSIDLIQSGNSSRQPRVHKFCEEALRSYMYYKYIQRKRGIPANEKQMAKRAYYNERRLARARMMNFNKEAAMQVSRKAFKQSPKI